MSSRRKIPTYPVCPRCGSANVVADSAARWSIKSGEWLVANVFDKGHGCDECGAEDIQFVWVKEQAQEVRR